MSSQDLRRPAFRPLSPPSSDPALSSFSSASRIASYASYASTPSMSALDSRYAGASRPLLLGHDYDLPSDPESWGAILSPELKEPDDSLHAPDYSDLNPRGLPAAGFSWRGLFNVGTLLIIFLGILTLFAGYPLISYFTRQRQSNLGGFNLGGINASGQVPLIPGNFGLIDMDTPQSAYTKPSWMDGKDWDLVFSDEFNVDGRTFWPGDDPYWEAVDLHYWQTNNLEWYDPSAITTQDGSLVITLSQKDNHNLNYQGGMMSSWNKFCFTGGYIEANVSLPGVNNIVGLWPAIWTMGNLGRAGYGASLEGMWPYTYDSCDIGTTPNQTLNGQPQAALVDGDPDYGGILSFLPGQKLSRCTCPGGSHPGPMHSDGTFVGRSAPEIDMFEAQISGGTGQVSQSAQWAPFNANYAWLNSSANEIITDSSISYQNTYTGGITQQATSVVTETDQSCYEGNGGGFSIYGFEYAPGFDNGYITWVSNNKVSWTLNVAGMAADPLVEISARPVPQEPMYMITNLGMSTNFGPVDLANLPFPVHLRVDYIRVYQPHGQHNIGCDPPDFPTAAYIDEYADAYTNPNLTTWRDDYGQPFPKNKLLGQC